MAFKNFSGILLDPDGEVCAGDRLRFTQQTITGQVLAGAVSYLDIAPDGSYSIDLQYGVILIDHYDSDSKKWRLQGAVTVNENTKATDLPGLLGESTPPTDEQIKLFEDLLTQAKEAAAAAEVAALAARASALAAEDSEKAAAASAAEAKEAAAKVAADLAQSIELALQVAKDAADAAESAAAAAISASDAQDAAIATAKDATAAAASSASASKSAIAAADSAAAAAISAGQAGDAAASVGSAAAETALHAQEAKEAAASASNSKEVAEYNGGRAEAAKEQAMRSESAAKLSEIAAKGAQEIAAGSAKSAMEDALKAAISAEFVAGKADIIKDQVITVTTSTTKAVQSAVAAEASAKRAEAAAGSFFSSIIDAGDWSAATGEYPAPETQDMSYIWRCIEAGAVGEVNFSVNDFLLYSAASQEFTKIGGGSSGSSFISDLPIGDPWQSAQRADSAQDDKVTISGTASSTREDASYKIDKKNGSVRVVYQSSDSNFGSQEAFIRLPLNCVPVLDTFFINFHRNNGTIYRVLAEKSSDWWVVRLRREDTLPTDKNASVVCDFDIPVLFDGVTLEAMQEASPTAFRVAPLAAEASFDELTVMAAPAVTGSSLLYRFADTTEIRIVGSIACELGQDGKAEIRIALPTAFKFNENAVFVGLGGFFGTTPQVAIVKQDAGELVVNITGSANTSNSFMISASIPVARK